MRRFDAELEKIKNEYFDSSSYLMLFDEYGDLFNLLNQNEVSYDDFLKIKAEYKKAKELSNKQVLIDKILEKVRNGIYITPDTMEDSIPNVCKRYCVASAYP